MPPFLIILLVGIVLSLLAGVAIGRVSLTQGNLGEAFVADVITAHFKRPHVLLNNVTFQMENGTAQIDHILVADTGIFVIETKNYTGWIFGHPNDSHWMQVIYRKKSRFLNPFHQNYGHVKAIKSLFTLPDEAFIPVVVFIGDAEFKSDFGPTAVKLNNLIAFLSEERPVIFDERKMAYIVGRIEMKRMRRSLETDEYHLNSVRSRIQARHHGAA